MKRLLFLMLSLLALTARAQVITLDSIHFSSEGEFSIVIPVEATADQIHVYSRSYFVLRNAIRSTEILSDDLISHKLQVQSSQAGDDLTIYTEKSTFLLRHVQERYFLTVTAKDNRMRIQVKLPMFDLDTYNELGTDLLNSEKGRMYSDHISYAQKYGQLEDLTERVNHNRALRYSNMILDLINYINEQTKLDNF